MKIRIPKFFRAFQLMLAGYAAFGRGFAYIGYPPLFIGEVMLAFGLMRTRLLRTLAKLLVLPAGQILALFIAVCALRALHDFPTYKLDTLRDSAVWYYSLFAIVIGALLIEEPKRILFAIEQFHRFIPVYVVIGPLVWVLGYNFADRLPVIPGTAVSILSVKGGDIVVHLTAMVTFFYLGLSRFSIVTLCIAFLGLLIIGASGRTALVIPILSFAFVFCLRPRMTFVLASLGLFLIAGLAFSVLDLNTASDAQRQFNFAQIWQNLLSIFGWSGSIDLDATRQWRLDWWHQIFQYTFHGDYFWSGKGFGVNLALDDGIVEALTETEPLRSPHNSHLSFLARGGVPLFSIWILLQLSWAVNLLLTALRARSRGEKTWENISIFLLTYWLAMIINANFDVYLEGPMGGIWFWTIWGFGLAVMWLYRYRPLCLAALAPIATAAPSQNLTPQPAE